MLSPDHFIVPPPLDPPKTGGSYQQPVILLIVTPPIKASGCESQENLSKLDFSLYPI